jgi:hypothetical protein
MGEPQQPDAAQRGPAALGAGSPAARCVDGSMGPVFQSCGFPAAAAGWPGAVRPRR